MKPCVPTVAGDVVIAHRQAVRPGYDVCLVIADGQQTSDGSLFRPMGVANLGAAERLARGFVVPTGTVFLYELESNAWTILPP